MSRVSFQIQSIAENHFCVYIFVIFEDISMQLMPFCRGSHYPLSGFTTVFFVSLIVLVLCYGTQIMKIGPCTSLIMVTVKVFDTYRVIASSPKHLALIGQRSKRRHIGV